MAKTRIRQKTKEGEKDWNRASLAVESGPTFAGGIREERLLRTMIFTVCVRNRLMVIVANNFRRYGVDSTENKIGPLLTLSCE